MIGVGIAVAVLIGTVDVAPGVLVAVGVFDGGLADVAGVVVKKRVLPVAIGVVIVGDTPVLATGVFTAGEPEHPDRRMSSMKSKDRPGRVMRNQQFRFMASLIRRLCYVCYVL